MGNGGELGHEALDKFFEWLEEHVERKITRGKVGDSCFAALMLVFAGVDSIGCLVHPEEEIAYKGGAKGKRGDRLKYVLRRYFGGEYRDRADLLYGLRCDLVHTAMNVGTLIDVGERYMRGLEHLEVFQRGGRDCLWVNSDEFARDFGEAVKKVKRELRENAAVRERAEGRCRMEKLGVDDQYVTATLPPGFGVFHVKCKRRGVCG